MLKIKNQEILFKILSCTFVVIMIVFILIYKNIVDLVYLFVMLILFIKYLFDICKK